MVGFGLWQSVVGAQGARPFIPPGMEVCVQNRSDAEDAARRLLELEQEREISGTATADEGQVAAARAALHAWVDTVTMVVAVPGSGKVSLVHGDGKTSHISSAPLAYALSPKVRFE